MNRINRVGMDVVLEQQPATTQGDDMSGDIPRRMLAEVTRVSQDFQRCRKQDEGPHVVKSHTPCDQPRGPGEEPHPGPVNFKQAPHEGGVACDQFCSGDEVCLFVFICVPQKKLRLLGDT